MFSIYQIFQSNKLVYTVAHTINNSYTDTTKLKIIFDAPITPYYLVNEYFRTPHLFSIKMIKTGLSNVLEAQEALSETQAKKKARRIKKKLDRLQF